MSRREHEDDYRYRFLSRFGSVILSGGIAAIPKALYMYSAELELVPQEVWFVGYILAHRWTAELPYPSLRKMSLHTGVSYQMLHRYKNSLIEKGYLEVIPRTRRNGGRSSNYYDFSGLFEQLERLLVRDNGGRAEDLEGDDEDESTPSQPQFTTPGKRQVTDPGKPGLSGASKRGSTAPVHPSGQHVNRTTDQESPEETRTSISESRAEFRPFGNGSLDARKAWATVLMDLKTLPGADGHLRGTRILGRDDSTLYIGASSVFSAGWLDRRLSHRAAALLSSLGGEAVKVRFVAESEWGR